MVIGRQVISGFKARLNLSGAPVKASWQSPSSIVVLPFTEGEKNEKSDYSLSNQISCLCFPPKHWITKDLGSVALEQTNTITQANSALSNWGHCSLKQKVTQAKCTSMPEHLLLCVPICFVHIWGCSCSKQISRLNLHILEVQPWRGVKHCAVGVEKQKQISQQQR